MPLFHQRFSIMNRRAPLQSELFSGRVIPNAPRQVNGIAFSENCSYAGEELECCQTFGGCSGTKHLVRGRKSRPILAVEPELDSALIKGDSAIVI